MSNPLQGLFGGPSNSGQKSNPLAGVFGSQQPEETKDVISPLQPQAPSVGSEVSSQEATSPWTRDVRNLAQGAVGFLGKIAKVPEMLHDRNSELAAQTQASGLSFNKNPTDTFQHLNKVSEAVDKFSASLAPVDTKEVGKVRKFLDTGERFVGEMVASAPLFMAGEKAAGKVIEMFPTALRTRAAQAVADATKGMFSNPKIASGVAGGISAAPQEILAGVGTQAVVDPNSVSTPGGVAMAAGMSLIGAGVKGWQAANPNPVLAALHGQSPQQGMAVPASFLPPLTANTPEEARYALGKLVGANKKPEFFWDKLKDLPADIERKGFSGKSAFRVLGKEAGAGGNTKLNFEDRANLLSGSSAIADDAIFNRPYRINDANGAWEPVNMMSVHDIYRNLEPGRETIEFNGLLHGKHRLDPGVVEGIQAKTYKHPDMEGTVSSLATTGVPNKLENLAVAFNDLNKLNLKNRVSSDLLGFEEYDRLTQDFPNYVNMSRAFSTDKSITASRARVGGSERGGLVDPLHGLIANTQETVNKGKINQFYNNMYETFLEDPDRFKDHIDFKHAEELAPDAKMVKDILDEAKDHGMANFPTVLAEKLAAMKMVGEIDAASGHIGFIREGKLMGARVSDEMGEGFSMFRPQAKSTLTKVAGAGEKFPRTATSLFLDLSGLGTWKDTFGAYINAPKEAGINPVQIITNPVRGLFHTLTKSNDYKEMVGEGGKIAGRYIGQTEPDIAKTAKLLADHARMSGIEFTIAHPMEVLKQISSDLSNSTRMGMYMRLKDGGMTAAQAAVEARRVVTDPMQTGSAAMIKAFAAGTSYGNTGLQEINNIKRVMMKDPKRMALKGLISVAIPSAIAWSKAELENDDQIREMRNAPGGSSYDFWRINGKVVATPRPAWSIGQVFGTGMDTFLDATVKGEDNRKRWAEGFLGQIGVNTIPLSAQALYTLKSGQKFMGPLSESMGVTPGAQQGMDPGEMGSMKLSNASTFLAKLTDIDPYKWDSAIKGMLTPDGYKIEGLLERAASQVGFGKKKPLDIEASDLPMIQRYIKPYPSSNTASMRKFYDEYSKMSQVSKTVNSLESQGKLQELQTYLSNNKEAASIAPAYITMGKELASMRKMIELIAIQPEDAIPPELKKDRIQNLQLDMINLAKTFNKTIGDVQKSRKK